MLERITKTIRNRKGEGYIDVVVLILCAMLVIALAIKVLPVYTAKQKIDTFASELVRAAEMAGEIGSATSRLEEHLINTTGISPNVTWSRYGRVQLNGEISVTVTYTMDIGLFGTFGSFPVTLRSNALGKSEVYWK